MQLTDEEITTLKALAAAAPQLEALLGAPKPAPRTDSDDFEDTDDWLKRRIAGRSHDGNSLNSLQDHIENAWRK